MKGLKILRKALYAEVRGGFTEVRGAFLLRHGFSLLAAAHRT
jgi:hypothetical protein